MTEELPGIESATWLERRLERRSVPPAPDDAPPPRSAAVAPSPRAATPAGAALKRPKVPSPLPSKPPSARVAQPLAPPPDVLRPSTASTARPPAARLLHAALPSASAQSGGLAFPGRSVFAPNFGLRLAQLVVVAQAAIALITGSNLIRGTTSLAQLATGVNLPPTLSLAAHYGIALVVFGALLLIGAVVVSVPSQIVRTLLVVIEVVTLGLTLAAYFGGGSVLGFETVVGMGATGSGLIPFGAVVGLQSAAIYLLAIHPPTYRAFSR